MRQGEASVQNLMMDMDVLPAFDVGAYRNFEPNERHVNRFAPYDVLVMVYEGILRFAEDGKPVEVSAGQYYIQRRGLYQEGSIASECPGYYFIHFTGSYRPSEMKPMEHLLPLMGHADFKLLFPLFEKLDYLQISSASRLECCSVFYSILEKLFEGSSAPRQSEPVRQLMRLFSENMRGAISLDHLANITGYSKNRLIQIFREETGETPYAYLTRLRLDHAKRLLRTTDLSINEVSRSCGFGEYINLYKAFMRSEGVTPSAYRQLE